MLDGLATVLALDGRIVGVGLAPDGELAIERTCALAPDVLVVDLALPGRSGIQVTQHIVATCPQVRVLVLTVHEQRAYIDRILAAGASGYVSKRSALQQIVAAVHVIASGGLFVDQ